jgi:hypothetical protein
MDELFLRGRVLGRRDRTCSEIGVELTLLIAINRRCRIQLGRRGVTGWPSAAKQRPRKHDERRGDDRKRNDPEQRD